MWAINLRIAGVVLGTLALYTLLANSIPQVQSEVPRELSLSANVTPEQLVQAGEQVYTGIGGCTTCHGLGTRAPNLLTEEGKTGPIGARCRVRVSGKTCKQYLYESLTQPGAFVVSGYEPIMPDLTRTLSPPQIWALVAFLESLGGTVDVTAADIPAASAAPPPAGGSASGAMAGGTTDPMTLYRLGGCVGCHKLGAEGGVVGPDLTHIGTRLSANAIRQAILEPDATITKGYERFAGIMPKTFGDQMLATQLEALVRFLAAQQ